MRAAMPLPTARTRPIMAATVAMATAAHGGDQADTFALVIQPASGETWLRGPGIAGATATQRVALGDLLTLSHTKKLYHRGTNDASGSTTLPQLPAGNVAQRCSLEMREAPLRADAPIEPKWHGPAILLGTNATSDALRQRLQQAGVPVYEIAASGDVDAIVTQIEQICKAGPAPHLFITTASAGLPIDPLDEANWLRTRHETMIVPFFAAQKWVQLAGEGKWLDRATLVATTADGGRLRLCPRSGCGPRWRARRLLKAIFVEYAIMADLKNLRVKVIDAGATTSPAVVAADVCRELASGTMDYEVAYVGGRRMVPAAVAREVAFARPANIRHGSTWIITGGARGITAACALELGRRYGLKLHLIGSSPLNAVDPAWHELNAAGLQQLKSSVMIAARKTGKPFAPAWERVQKDMEIDRSLRAYAAAGVSVTYHACDVSNRPALAQALDQIRRQDGPIAGILHGAGVERSGRFDKKTREIALQTISVKVDGAANLMALTQRDPVHHFIGFGSISGRLGGFGQADYSLANEMLAKLVGAYRRQRPWIQAVTFHWHAWDEVGMAARPETKEILESAGNLQLMPLGEGIAHLLREVAAGAPEPEVMITERHHWERFSSGLAKMNAEAGAAASVQAAPGGQQPLLRNVQRGRLRRNPGRCAARSGA